MFFWGEVLTMTELYKRIEDLCKAYNITITKMCRDLKISRSAMSEFKYGRTKSISDRTIDLIADYFHVTSDYLTGIDISPFFNKSDFSELDLKIINLLPNLTEGQKKTIISLIEQFY